MKIFLTILRYIGYVLTLSLTGIMIYDNPFRAILMLMMALLMSCILATAYRTFLSQKFKKITYKKLVFSIFIVLMSITGIVIAGFVLYIVAFSQNI